MSSGSSANKTESGVASTLTPIRRQASAVVREGMAEIWRAVAPGDLAFAVTVTVSCLPIPLFL